jgi:DHA2 family multidrug resistance protein
LSSPASERASYDISTAERCLITSSVCVGSTATILTATIMNVAVPSVMGTFGVGQDKAQWVSTAFLAATTLAMLANDWSVRRLGARATYVGALVIFIAGSLLAGTATTFDVLILGRIMQGFAGGITQPLAMMTMFQIYPPEARGRAMGLFGLVIILAPAVGPWVGGITVDELGWRYTFFLPIPIAVMSIALASLFLKGRNPNIQAPRFDLIGFSLMTVAVVSLLVALTNGSEEGWSSDTILELFIIGGVSLTAFVFWELRIPDPLMRVEMFAIPRFAAANFVSFMFGAAIFASIYLVPLFVQLIQGYSPTESGLLQFPAGIAMAIFFPLVGRLTDFGRENWLTALGILLSAYAAYLMAGAHTNTSFFAFALWMVISRIGLSFIFPPLSTASLQVLPSEYVGQGSGAMNFTRTIGGAFGVNVTAIFVDYRSAVYRDAMTAMQHDGNSTTLELINELKTMWPGMGFPENIGEPLSQLFIGQAIIRQAEMLAFRDGFLLLAVAIASAIIPAIFIKKPGS